ncbi:MAG TPA: DUF2339 domain-containing protein, partial [Leucothrix sp.]|nr:DUF2339 domain-containing protein [Leucothrix sp.]
MRFLFAVIFLVASTFFWFELYEVGVVVIGLATILGFTLGKVFDLQKDLNALRATLAREWEERNATKQSITTTSNIATQTATKEVAHEATDIEKPSTPVVQPRAIAEELKAETSMSDTSVSEIKEVFVESVSRPIEENPPIKDTLFDKAGDVLKGYFTGGNLFVRIGIIILFFGVSFLLKYVSDQGLFPIEYRLIGVVVLAMAFLGLGWRLRLKNETYALLLQGAGIGILYLDIYAAFSLYYLLPAMATFVLLFVVSMFSAALAVLQDSKSLAVLGFSGGFIAPVLASSGSNNYVGLFSYYAILNLAIVVVAWFKSWRALNLLGFAFTFIIGTAWGVMTYKSENFASVEPFLI